jgi:hypothetical protein
VDVKQPLAENAIAIIKVHNVNLNGIAIDELHVVLAVKVRLRSSPPSRRVASCRVALARSLARPGRVRPSPSPSRRDRRSAKVNSFFRGPAGRARTDDLEPRDEQKQRLDHARHVARRDRDAAGRRAHAAHHARSDAL